MTYCLWEKCLADQIAKDTPYLLPYSFAVASLRETNISELL